jgi:hypothetical protein
MATSHWLDGMARSAGLTMANNPSAQAEWLKESVEITAIQHIFKFIIIKNPAETLHRVSQVKPAFS